jgi:hypothetical protein
MLEAIMAAQIQGMARLLKAMAEALLEAVMRTSTKTSITVMEVAAVDWTLEEVALEGQVMAMELEGLVQGNSRATDTWAHLRSCRKDSV